ncbi:hypothetical protein AAHH88_00310 [Candidatus Hodgkinia cicadicola]
MATEALLGGRSLWDLGSGSGGLSLSWCSRGGLKAVCFEANRFKLKLCVYNTSLANRTPALAFVNSGFEAGVIGLGLADRLFFGCGLKRLWSWRLVYTHLRIGARAVVVSVTSLGCFCVSALSLVYSASVRLVTVHKLKLKLNAKIYVLCSSVLVCVVCKQLVNVW